MIGKTRIIQRCGGLTSRPGAQEVDSRGALTGGEWVSTVKSREPLGGRYGEAVLQKVTSMLLGLKGSEIGHLEADPGLHVDGLVFVLTTRFLLRLMCEVVQVSAESEHFCEALGKLYSGN